MRRLAPLVLILAVGACAGARPAGGEPPASLAALWATLGEAFGALAALDTPCAEPFGTWFEEFGVRGLACVGAQATDASLLVAQAGGTVYTAGPHRVTEEVVALDLDAQRDFGRYDPVFVDWAVEHGVVGAERPLLRQALQPTYDAYVRRLARVYWLAHADLAADGFPASVPAGPLADYAAFLEGGPVPEGMESYGLDGDRNGGFSVFAFTGRSEGLLPRLGLDVANDWEVKYEANTAYGFWLRRRADGTQARWREGLERLLAVYDAAWLETQR